MYLVEAIPVLPLPSPSEYSLLADEDLPVVTERAGLPSYGTYQEDVFPPEWSVLEVSDVRLVRPEDTSPLLPDSFSASSTSSEGPLFFFAEVRVNVYELTAFAPLNYVLANEQLPIGGALHAGVEVFGKEWSYCGGRGPGTGVVADEPRGNRQHVFRESVLLGETMLSKDQVTFLIDGLLEEWRAEDYHWLHRNCLNFANELCALLGVGRLPPWVDRLARGVGLLDTSLQTIQKGAEQFAEGARDVVETILSAAGPTCGSCSSPLASAFQRRRQAREREENEPGRLPQANLGDDPWSDWGSPQVEELGGQCPEDGLEVPQEAEGWGSPTNRKSLVPQVPIRADPFLPRAAQAKVAAAIAKLPPLPEEVGRGEVLVHELGQEERSPLSERGRGFCGQRFHLVLTEVGRPNGCWLGEADCRGPWGLPAHPQAKPHSAGPLGRPLPPPAKVVSGVDWTPERCCRSLRHLPPSPPLRNLRL